MRTIVLYLYEFTLLSNYADYSLDFDTVLYLYEFTLLSNSHAVQEKSALVLYLYEFTLLSNHSRPHSHRHRSYTSMNLHYSQTGKVGEKVDAVSYTSMNLHYSQTSFAHFEYVLSLIPLWIYITLKL